MFEAGDRVICVNSKNTVDLLEHKVYIVKELKEERLILHGLPGTYMARRFILAKRDPIVPGDWVECLNGNFHCIGEGMIYQVESVYPPGEIHIKCDDGEILSYTFDDNFRKYGNKSKEKYKLDEDGGENQTIKVQRLFGTISRGQEFRSQGFYCRKQTPRITRSHIQDETSTIRG